MDNLKKELEVDDHKITTDELFRSVAGYPASELLDIRRRSCWISDVGVAGYPTSELLDVRRQINFFIQPDFVYDRFLFTRRWMIK